MVVVAKLVSVKAYDGTIVRVSEDKVKEFVLQQAKIKELLDKGMTIEEIIKLIDNGDL